MKTTDRNDQTSITPYAHAFLTSHAYNVLRAAGEDFSTDGDPHREAVEAIPGRWFRIENMHPEHRQDLAQVAYVCASEIKPPSRAFRGRLEWVRDSLRAWELRRFGAKLMRSVEARP